MYNVLFWIRNVFQLASIAVIIVMGILIVVSKVKPTKILGVGYLISSFSSLLTVAFTLLSYFAAFEKIYKLRAPLTVLSCFCTIGSLVCICIFLHKSYGKSKVYIPILAIELGTWVLSIGAVGIVNRLTSVFGTKRGLTITMIQSFTGFATSAAISIIIISILYSNRQKEMIIPHAWLIKIITLIWAFLYFLFTLFTNYITLSVSQSYKYGNPFIEFWNTCGGFIYCAVSVLVSLVSLIMPIYIYMSTRRASDYYGQFRE